jgi:hypothetical protein
MQIYENVLVENAKNAKKESFKGITAEKLNDNQDFLNDLGNAYLNAEVDRKYEQLSEYMIAYNSLEDKESFNGQYLNSLIEQIKIELSE